MITDDDIGGTRDSLIWIISELVLIGPFLYELIINVKSPSSHSSLEIVSPHAHAWTLSESSRWSHFTPCDAIWWAARYEPCNALCWGSRYEGDLWAALTYVETWLCTCAVSTHHLCTCVATWVPIMVRSPSWPMISASNKPPCFEKPVHTQLKSILLYEDISRHGVHQFFNFIFFSSSFPSLDYYLGNLVTPRAFWGLLHTEELQDRGFGLLIHLWLWVERVKRTGDSFLATLQGDQKQL